MPRFVALRAEWRRRPPAHWLLAAALRYRAPEPEASRRQPSVNELEVALSQDLKRKRTKEFP